MGNKRDIKIKWMLQKAREYERLMIIQNTFKGVKKDADTTESTVTDVAMQSPSTRGAMR